MQDIRILGANYTKLHVSSNVGSLAEMLDNLHHKDVSACTIRCVRVSLQCLMHHHSVVPALLETCCRGVGDRFDRRSMTSELAGALPFGAAA